MARIRTVKPELFKHEDLFDAERDSGLPLRLAFIGLFTVADREGRFKWKPRTIKAEVMPHDDVDFSRVLDALSTRGFVVRYACSGVEYGCIPSFPRHQVINNREAASDLPAPPVAVVQPSFTSNNINDIDANETKETRVIDASGTRDSRDEHAGSGEGKGREGKGTEGKEENNAPRGGAVTSPAAAHVPGSLDLPPPTELPTEPKKPPKAPKPDRVALAIAVISAPTLWRWAGEKGFTEEEVNAHYEYFVNYIRSTKKSYDDYYAAFQNCMTSDWGKVLQGLRARKRIAHGANRARSALDASAQEYPAEL